MISRLRCLAALISVAAIANAQDFGPPTLNLFDPAPEIALKFVKGKPITLEEGRTENVFVIEFWATWCAPCKVTIPHLTRLQKKYADEGLIVIGVSDEDLATVQPFVIHMGDQMDYRVAIDAKRTTINQYTKPFKINAIPYAFVVDKRGTLIWHGHPADPLLEDIVDALLEEKVEPEEDAEEKESAAPEPKEKQEE